MRGLMLAVWSSFRLGRHLVGRAASCDVAIVDPDIEAHHLLLEFTARRGHSCRAVGRAVDDHHRWLVPNSEGSVRDGGVIEVGATRLTLRVCLQRSRLASGGGTGGRRHTMGNIGSGGARRRIWRVRQARTWSTLGVGHGASTTRRRHWALTPVRTATCSRCGGGARGPSGLGEPRARPCVRACVAWARCAGAEFGAGDRGTTAADRRSGDHRHRRRRPCATLESQLQSGDNGAPDAEARRGSARRVRLIGRVRPALACGLHS